MADSPADAADAPAAPTVPIPTLEELQHWTWVMGRAQQLMMEHLAGQWSGAAGKAADPAKFATAFPAMNWFADPAKLADMQVQLWTEGLNVWQRALGGHPAKTEVEAKAEKDKRFAAPEWREHP